MSESLPRIVVLISGRGSNMQALVEARLPVQIAAVISNRADAAGLKYAQSQGIPVCVLEAQGFATRESYDEKLKILIESFRPELVVLAGFMRILSVEFVQHFARRLINIHPSLLPSFTGLHTHQRAIDSGVKIHGCTVHFVTEDLDAGPIVAQAAVVVLSTDNEDTLASRVLREEHKLYPRVIRWWAEGLLCWQENNTVVLQKDCLQPPLLSPGVAHE